MEKDKKELQENKNDEVEVVETPKKERRYIDYTTRVIFVAVMFIIFLGAGVFLIAKSFKVEDAKVITYAESSDLDYRVYLKANNFYEQEYLNKNMIYVASLIDKVNIDFNYRFNTDTKTDVDINYSVAAKLSIVDASGKSFYEKNYTLIDNKAVSMKDEMAKEVKEAIVIDYDYYNSIANRFKNSYGVNADSKLTVTMVINKKNSKDNKEFVINDTDNMSVDIPLSEKAININMNYSNINDQGSFVGQEKVTMGNITKLVAGVVLVLVGLYFLFRLVKLGSKSLVETSKYDRYIAKLLKEYDRLIVETSTLTSFDDKEIVKVKSFNELLDVRDNLKVPIMYYIITKHVKSYFYIRHENSIYLYVVKAVDVEEDKTIK